MEDNSVYKGLKSQALKNAKLWESWYRAQVPEVHSERYEKFSGVPVLCNCLSLNLPKLMVKHMRNYILSEMEYVEEIRDNLTELFGEPEDLKNLVDIGLVYGSYMVFIEDYITDTNKWNLHVVPPTLISQTNGVLEFSAAGYLVKVEQDTGGTWIVQWFNEGKFIQAEAVDYCPYIMQTWDTDPQYPLGKSMFADSLDAFKALDFTYTEMYNALELGRNMILVDETALEHDYIPVKSEEGATTKVERVSYLARDNRQFRIVKRPDGATTDPVHHIQADLKVEEYERGLNVHIQIGARGSGFDNGYFRYDSASGVTATAVISSKGDLFTSITHHQKRLVRNLCEIYNTLFEESSLVTDTDSDSSTSVSELGPDMFEFGDSIIVDDEATQAKGLQLYNAGVITKEYLLSAYYNYTDEEIVKAIPELPSFTLEAGG